nr:hypothetical protein HK105_006792 [Polyrhizophydium stewartii]
MGAWTENDDPEPTGFREEPMRLFMREKYIRKRYYKAPAPDRAPPAVAGTAAAAAVAGAERKLTVRMLSSLESAPQAFGPLAATTAGSPRLIADPLPAAHPFGSGAAWGDADEDFGDFQSSSVPSAIPRGPVAGFSVAAAATAKQPLSPPAKSPDLGFGAFQSPTTSQQPPQQPPQQAAFAVFGAFTSASKPATPSGPYDARRSSATMVPTPARMQSPTFSALQPLKPHHTGPAAHTAASQKALSPPAVPSSDIYSALRDLSIAPSTTAAPALASQPSGWSSGIAHQVPQTGSVFGSSGSVFGSPTMPPKPAPSAAAVASAFADFSSFASSPPSRAGSAAPSAQGTPALTPARSQTMPQPSSSAFADFSDFSSFTSAPAASAPSAALAARTTPLSTPMAPMRPAAQPHAGAAMTGADLFSANPWASPSHHTNGNHAAASKLASDPFGDLLAPVVQSRPLAAAAAAAPTVAPAAFPPMSSAAATTAASRTANDNEFSLI